MSNLAEQAAVMVGNRPVYTFSVYAGDKPIKDFGEGNIKVQLPYTLLSGEDANAVILYTIDGDSIDIMPYCIYDKDLEALIFKIGYLPSSSYAVGYNKVEFKDIDLNWAKDFITYLSSRNIIIGYEGMYNPSSNITRAEFVKILATIAGADLEEYNSSSFIDIDEGDWYLKYAEWAAAKGITLGKGSKDTFKPNHYITREEIATMIVRFAKEINYTLPKKIKLSSFADQSNISSYAQEAAAIVQQAGIITGKEIAGGTNKYFAPKDNADRAEIAKMLAVFMMTMAE